MDSFRQLWQDFGFLIRGTLVVMVVAFALGALSKIFKTTSENVSGKKFRNQVVMSLATFVGILAIILGLPLDKNTQSQLLTLIGIILSATIALSGSTILSNAMAGIMLKTVRNFRSGDFISTGEYIGRVTERGLFHTEIQTPDRDLTTLPNLLLATQAVTVLRLSGTIVSATVSLGYDVHHSKIEELLIRAAQNIELDEPFVQILELGDFTVTYRAAGLLKDSKQVLTYRSRLRGSILDSLHEAGVEILSPDFTSARVYPPTQDFIPVSTPVPTTTVIQDAAPVDVVFDKAEDAESLSRLREKYKERDQELKECKKQLKEVSSEEEKQPLEARIAVLEKMKAALETAIQAAENRDSEQDD